MLNTHELEQLFASDHSSPIFPILASNYYDKKLYKYAVKVCKIGLHSDPDNLEGLYILAKSLLMSGEEKNAAILLKKNFKAVSLSLTICFIVDTCFRRNESK